MRTWPGAILIPLLAASSVVASCRSDPAVTEAALRRARSERDVLSARLSELAARDPLAAEALGQQGDVLVGIRAAKVEEIVQEVARRYLDKVVLDLGLEARVEERGEVRVKALLWKVHAGDWQLELVVHRVRGVLAAGAPRLSTADRRSIGVELPVTLQEGSGTASVRFVWNARSAANAVCRDFEVRRRLRGLVLAEEYTLSGEFRLTPGREALRAEPIFPQRRFRLRLDLDPDSWRQVRAALEEQDTVLKCGIALDPDRILGTLRKRLNEGFMIRLPRALFRPIDFPAALRQSVAVEGNEVSLALTTGDLAITPQAVWYSVRVQAGAGEPSTSAPALP